MPSYARGEVLRKLGLVGAIALLTAGAASAAGGATASLSNTSPGARDVSVTIVLADVPLHCGQMNVRSVSIALPAAMGVPGTISARDAHVAGRQVQLS